MTRGSTGSRPAAFGAVALRGVVAGLAGVGVMTAAEKAEQALTHRPDSYVRARSLLILLGRSPGDRDRPLLWNHAMHWDTAHKAVYSLVTGLVAERLVAPSLRSGRGRTSH